MGVTWGRLCGDFGGFLRERYPTGGGVAGSSLKGAVARCKRRRCGIPLAVGSQVAQGAAAACVGLQLPLWRERYPTGCGVAGRGVLIG